MARGRVWVQMLDGRRVAMAARDPAGGQRDGLIPARKGAPEQRPRPTTPPSLPGTVRALLSSGGYGLGALQSVVCSGAPSSNQCPFHDSRENNPEQATKAQDQSRHLHLGSPARPWVLGARPHTSAASHARKRYVPRQLPRHRVYLRLHLDPGNPTDVQSSTYTAARYIPSIQPRAAI